MLLRCGHSVVDLLNYISFVISVKLSFFFSFLFFLPFFFSFFKVKHVQIYLHNAKEILRFISILWDVVMWSGFAV